MVMQPIQSTTLQEAVYNAIFRAIVSGTIPPGNKLTLEDLAKQLSVSIMPVREAIRKLEAGNLISIKKNRRIVVKELSSENLKEILNIRLYLEGLAAKRAAKVRSESSIKQLEKLIDAMNSSKDEETYLRFNREFHRTIYKEANLPILLEVIDILWERISPYLHILLREEKLVNIKTLQKNHKGMLGGMQQKNPSEVCKWLKSDLTQAANTISRMFKKQE
jgi:DNA-binding GntR family transcriptional regulator